MSHIKRWKVFIKGPNLHEGTTNEDPSKPKPVIKDCDDGISISQFYQEIINQPSSSSSVLSNSKNSTLTPKRKSISSTSTSKTRSAPSKPSLPSPPLPSFTQLLKFAQDDNINELTAALTSCSDRIDLNQVDSFGWTLLIVAACAGNEKCVKLLLEKGANWKIVDRKGLNAYSVAKKNHKYQVCKIIHEWEKSEEERRKRQEETEKYKSLMHQNKIREEEEKLLHKNPEFCEPCKTQVGNKSVHEKSIAHLVTTAKDDPQKVHYGIPESNIGFQLMVKSGWDTSTGLGPEGTGQKFPIKTVLKQDRVGLGTGNDKKLAKVTHFLPFDTSAVETKKPKKDIHVRVERKSTIEKKEEIRRRQKDRRKEIKLRRELGGL